MRISALMLLSLCFGCRTGDKSELGVSGDSAALAVADGDGDGFTADEDCDDSDASINSGATEVCDGVDNDCDGEIDEGVTDTWYADADGDGYGDSLAAEEACSQPADTSTSATDCDDTDDAIHPAASERCDHVDNDCDGEIDEDVSTTWYADEDGDGWGDPDSSVDDCDPPSSYVDNAEDCDDTTELSAPDGTEVCDELDNDCDGEIDEDSATDASTWYSDGDGDGYGDSSASTVACDAPSATVADATDCDDGAFDVNPAATEICDTIDNDCDGVIDDLDASLDTSTGSTWYADSDSDGYGDVSSTTQACLQPSGYIADATDCDDGVTAVNPAASEICDTIDNDCDGYIDDADSSVDVTTGSTWYADTDTDGYGDASSSSQACAQPSGSVADATDCDDGDITEHPSAAEACDGEDDDCDGDIDEGVTGSGSACPAESCDDVLADQPSATDDLYWVEGSGGSLFEAWCDMTEDNGGWTLVATIANDGTRNWNTLAAFTDTTTFGSVSSSSSDFKSEAMSEIEGHDLLVITDDYAMGFYSLLGGSELATWINDEYDSAACNSTYEVSGADYYDGLTAAQAAGQNVIVRPLDTNANCFPSTNENALLGFQAAACCWAGGLGNTPGGQASWRTHDLSLLLATSMSTASCTAGTYPCNDNGTVMSYGSFCYGTSCKATFAEIYVR